MPPNAPDFQNDWRIQTLPHISPSSQINFPPPFIKELVRRLWNKWCNSKMWQEGEPENPWEYTAHKKMMNILLMLVTEKTVLRMRETPHCQSVVSN